MPKRALKTCIQLIAFLLLWIHPALVNLRKCPLTLILTQNVSLELFTWDFRVRREADSICQTLDKTRSCHGNTIPLNRGHFCSFFPRSFSVEKTMKTTHLGGFSQLYHALTSKNEWIQKLREHGSTRQRSIPVLMFYPCWWLALSFQPITESKVRHLWQVVVKHVTLTKYRLMRK